MFPISISNRCHVSFFQCTQYIITNLFQIDCISLNLHLIVWISLNEVISIPIMVMHVRIYYFISVWLGHYSLFANLNHCKHRTTSENTKSTETLHKIQINGWILTYNLWVRLVHILHIWLNGEHNNERTARLLWAPDHSICSNKRNWKHEVLVKFKNEQNKIRIANNNIEFSFDFVYGMMKTYKNPIWFMVSTVTTINISRHHWRWMHLLYHHSHMTINTRETHSFHLGIRYKYILFSSR